MSLVKRIENFNTLNNSGKELSLVTYDTEKVGCESLNVTIYYDKDSLIRDPESYLKKSIDSHKTYLARLDQHIDSEIKQLSDGEVRLNFCRGTKKNETKVLLKLQTLAMYLTTELIMRPFGENADNFTNNWVIEAERKYDNYKILSGVMNYGSAFLEENVGNYGTLTSGLGEKFQMLRYTQSKIPAKIKLLEQISREQIQSAIESAKYFTFKDEKEKLSQLWNTLKQRVF